MKQYLLITSFLLFLNSIHLPSSVKYFYRYASSIIVFLALLFLINFSVYIAFSILLASLMLTQFPTLPLYSFTIWLVYFYSSWTSSHFFSISFSICLLFTGYSFTLTSPILFSGKEAVISNLTPDPDSIVK